MQPDSQIRKETKKSCTSQMEDETLFISLKAGVNIRQVTYKNILPSS